MAYKCYNYLFFAFRSSKDGGSGSVGDGVNESEKNIVTSSQDFWDWRSSFSDIGGGQKVLLASTLSSPGMIHIPRNTVLQQESLQVKLNFYKRYVPDIFLFSKSI